jgi:O-acetyl-ADP-ribose deacetylase (regulator of RNase III)
MTVRFGETEFALLEGDLTRQDVDAIVNAANSSLMGGGGVDGAIHRAGGPAILEDCYAIVRRIGHLRTGEVVITTGGKLPARHVIHTVGPVWQDGNEGEPALLANAYRNSLKVALENGLKTVAFPSISTGVFGYPLDLAATVAISTVRSFCETHPGLEAVRMVLFGEAALQIYEAALKAELARE